MYKKLQYKIRSKLPKNITSALIYRNKFCKYFQKELKVFGINVESTQDDLFHLYFHHKDKKNVYPFDTSDIRCQILD